MPKKVRKEELKTDQEDTERAQKIISDAVCKLRSAFCGELLKIEDGAVNATEKMDALESLYKVKWRKLRMMEEARFGKRVAHEVLRHLDAPVFE
ncbi:MAG: hypothetical protein AAF429_12275 [Pseudomonadota bacterium]